jgi:hypothetical protein
MNLINCILKDIANQQILSEYKMIQTMFQMNMNMLVESYHDNNMDRLNPFQHGIMNHQNMMLFLLLRNI